MARGKPSTSKSGKEKKKAKARLHLRHGKPCGSELRKIALLQIEAALESLRGNNVSPEPVHDARTYIKKLRAILQLASPVMSKKERDQPTILLREAAVRLAPLRDSEVRIRTLDWPLDDLQGKDLKRRIRRSYRRGRTALDLCSTTPDPDPFHLWRKQVKQLWYQLRITAPYWKDEAADLIAATDKIGQLAGDERDLTLLRETLRLGPQGNATSLLIEKIDGLLPPLRRDAVEAGRSFYENRPKLFVAALEF